MRRRYFLIALVAGAAVCALPSASAAQSTTTSAPAALWNDDGVIWGTLPVGSFPQPPFKDFQIKGLAWGHTAYAAPRQPLARKVLNEGQE